ncbi:hypothetical protein A2U01_0014321, partial [Trifolium medium]|nr:hypothetical protein [Trifolium medium]
ARGECGGISYPSRITSSLCRTEVLTRYSEQGWIWASSRPSPEQEPPKLLLLGIGVMTLGLCSCVEAILLVAFYYVRGRIRILLVIILWRFHTLLLEEMLT